MTVSHVDLRTVRGFVFDVDGTLILSESPDWSGAVPLPGAVELLQWLREQGYPFALFTSGSTHRPEIYATRLRAAGLPIEDWQVITTGVTAAEIIATDYPGRSVYVLGEEGTVAPLQARGIRVVDGKEGETAGVVLVGWSRSLTYDQLDIACRAVWNGADLLVTSAARAFVSKRGLKPGWSWSIAIAIAETTGKHPRVVGKPSVEALRAVARLLGTEIAATAVVGDDPDLELRMGRDAGAPTVQVRTGRGSEPIETPLLGDLVVSGVGELLELLREACMREGAADR
ncbi:HAD hydrolase-like protein [Thermomicrobium sp. 4228-Ro]|uniref:HAD-IIA family hydrolase n=1 Tax=Thermomicrobium sp. 4228-Ro TaxID=2993937 RepID=UPI002249934A|nr:HAD hydrolase-like protein [Thermomicrobium sp. 4228-Ro]MCX2727025.1 HAD hydrolase-like protein [Thermomicrobium sp. 4228-Ro]